jgi:hypothetical protein
MPDNAAFRFFATSQNSILDSPAPNLDGGTSHFLPEFKWHCHKKQPCGNSSARGKCCVYVHTQYLSFFQQFDKMHLLLT